MDSRVVRSARPRCLVVLALCLVASGLLPARAGASERADTALVREQLADGIWVFRAPSSLDLWTATNIVVIENERDVTVFDSNSRAGTARQVIAEIRKLTPKPVRTLINSHWHLDHWSGNDEYVKAFPGVQIIATTETRDYMKRMGGTFYSHGLRQQATRERAALDSAIRTGREADGTPLTPEERRKREADLRQTSDFAAEVTAVPRVLPTMAFRDSLILWSGRREYRLLSVTGDATASAVLWLPAERILVMGDVLVRPEEGDGPPPWTTNSYAITPWRNSLRALDALDAAIIVPGQGAALRDEQFLRTTIELWTAIIDQVHAALERGLATQPEIMPTLQLAEIGRRYVPGSATPGPAFDRLVSALVRKVIQESYDGVSR